MTRRNLYFAIAIGLSLALFHTPLAMLVRLALQDGTNSDYIPLIPFISAFLIYFLEKEKIFADVQWRLGGPAAMFGVGIGLYWFAQRHAGLGGGSYLPLQILGVVVIWISVFFL